MRPRRAAWSEALLADPGEHAADLPPLATVRLLRDRNFGAYFAGNLVSACGMWFQLFALSILVYRLTHSAFLLGVANFALFAGTLLLAPWTGSAADRFDRRRLLMTTQAGAIAITTLLALVSGLGVASTPLVIGLALVGGIAFAFSTPALHSLIPALVDRSQLPAAVALNSATFNLSRVIGPVLAAVVIDKAGVTWSFALAGVLYLALIAALLFIRPLRRQEPPGVRPRLRDSLAELRRNPRLALLLTIVAVVGLTADPVSTLGPAFATRVFDRSDTLAGVFLGAFGVGAVAAAFLLGGRSGRSLVRVAATLAVVVAGIAGFAFSPSLALALPLLVVAGFGFLASNAAATTHLQMEVDDRQRGRVMALWGIAFLGIRPLGSLVDGALASAAGLRVAALAMTLPALLVAGALLLLARPHPR